MQRPIIAQHLLCSLICGMCWLIVLSVLSGSLSNNLSCSGLSWPLLASPGLVHSPPGLVSPVRRLWTRPVLSLQPRLWSALLLHLMVTSTVRTNPTRPASTESTILQVSYLTCQSLTGLTGAAEENFINPNGKQPGHIWHKNIQHEDKR